MFISWTSSLRSCFYFVWFFHCDKFVSVGILGSNAILSGRQISVSWKNILSPSCGWISEVGGGIIFLWHSGNCFHVHIVLLPRRPTDNRSHKADYILTLIYVIEGESTDILIMVLGQLIMHEFKIKFAFNFDVQMMLINPLQFTVSRAISISIQIYLLH
jgi:hypothetical protein